MCDRCEWEEYVETGMTMMDDPEYDFAIETVESIMDWVQRNEHITEKQKEALTNIETRGGR